MTATYANRFDAPQSLSATQERSLLTALGLGLVVTVLALAWAAVASRVERVPALSAPNQATVITQKTDTGALLRVEVPSAQWSAEDASF